MTTPSSIWNGTKASLSGWWQTNRLNRSTLRSEAIAGIPGAIGSVPDGMAASLLTGVNPIHGLYASLVGPIAGGAVSSTPLMVVTTTSAAALIAGSALASIPVGERPEALFMLTLLAGIFMLLAGIFKLGRYVRFVSHSVMIGFLTGVGANIVLGQLGDFTGGDAEGSVALTRAWSVLTSPGSWYLPTLAAGLIAIGLVAWLGNTRLSPYSALLALVVPTALLEVLGTSGVRRVKDVGDIPSGIPLPHFPRLGSLSLDVIVGALAVAAIVLVQGAGVGESSPNADGSRSDTNQDFIAQGAGNVASALFRGQPVGGSVGQTALNASAGARTRWAAMFSGFWMLLILVAFSGLVGYVAMPTLAAVLIFAAINSFRVREIRMVLMSGFNSQISMASTFVATLFLPIAAAVGIGVVLSLLMQLNQELVDLRVVELRPRDNGTFEEVSSPKKASSRSVTVLDVYGSLLYAGARTLQVNLPDPADAEYPVVVLRLRGRCTLGATFLVVIADYADRLAAVGGHLILCGVDTAVMARIERARRRDLAEKMDLVLATPIVGESTLLAVEQAQAWLDNALGTTRGDD